MKKSIIIILSVLAITFTFSGCGGSEGSISGNTGSDIPTASTPVVETPSTAIVVDIIETSLDASKISIEESLGVPIPANPGN